MNNQVAGFISILPLPSGSLKNAWRGHRTVVLPDYQGMGFGMRISNAMGEMVRADGGRYFSKTAHPRMRQYRDASPLWRPTSKNGKARPDYASGRKTKESGHKYNHINRTCGSHEYIGATP